jgi:chromosome segregation ATPase
MMKALWLREVQAILQRDDFVNWCKSRENLEQKLSAARVRHEELLAQVTLMDFRADLTQKKAIDILYRAGEYEDVAAQLIAEASEIENKSYEAVANFEMQRIVCSDWFSRMGRAENDVLKAQDSIREKQALIEANKRSEQTRKLQQELKLKQTEVARSERELRETSATYERENNRKIRLWEEVEQLWVRSLDINLSVSERKLSSKRARQESEQLFNQAEHFKQSAETLRRESDQASQKQVDLQNQIDELRSSARRLFGCLVGDEFLYWPRRENNKHVYCVPMAGHPDGFNIELLARNVYLVNWQRGVEFIEPVPPFGEVHEEQDKRIEAFFTAGPGSAVS